MTTSWMLFVLLLVLTICLISLTFLTLRWSRTDRQQQTELIQNLLNRVQALDIRSYSALESTASPVADKYVSQDDFSEAQRISALTGLGETVYVDDAAAEAFSDGFGLEIQHERRDRISE